MCGIFGVISKDKEILSSEINYLAKKAMRRGMDSSGLIISDMTNRYVGYRANFKVSKLLENVPTTKAMLCIGHSRLITNGLNDNQPVYRDDIAVLHNGIIVNDNEIWSRINSKPLQTVDTEVINAIAKHSLNNGYNPENISLKLKELCNGTVSCAILFHKIGKLFLYTNNSSLYISSKENTIYFHSEKHALESMGCNNIKLASPYISLDIGSSMSPIEFRSFSSREENILSDLGKSLAEEKKLIYKKPSLTRCTKCILPSTMPFIKFNENGICNYCLNYKKKEITKSTTKLRELIEKYRNNNDIKCILPFSGGRDSSYALHVVVNELKLKPITMTYDWGMVTDLARRNISRMCSKLNIENIIIADDLKMKRRNIALNLNAWLKNPHLGMLNILMAGDKHFFKHIETIKKEYDTSLNIWGMNPLEVTHFKAGFLGFPPEFEHSQVFYTGFEAQLKYQYLRFKHYLTNPAYFNRSMYDTLSGEYYRSIKSKSGFHNIFDYIRWDEASIESTLKLYDWELAPDTNSTWRIGDGTAAFYNYVYYTVAGFSEFDTFRSNQIREGSITRARALELVNIENTPRYPNIKWYLDTLGFDFNTVIDRINSVQPLYEQ